jgi:hypothetical protein
MDMDTANKVLLIKDMVKSKKTQTRVAGYTKEEIGNMLDRADHATGNEMKKAITTTTTKSTGVLSFFFWYGNGRKRRETSGGRKEDHGQEIQTIQYHNSKKK